MEFSHSRLPQTLPEALLLLAHDPHTGKIKRGNWMTQHVYVNRLNRALFVAGLLELILWDRIVPIQYRTESNLLLYRLVPDFDPLPTAYITMIWSQFFPETDMDVSYPFRRLVRIAQVDRRFGDGFEVPDQTKAIAWGMGEQGVSGSTINKFTWGAISPFPEDYWVLNRIEVTLTSAIFPESNIAPDQRTLFLLGLLYACDLVRPLFGSSHEDAEKRIRSLCRFSVEPETPIGNAVAFIICQDSAA